MLQFGLLRPGVIRKGDSSGLPLVAPDCSSAASAPLLSDSSSASTVPGEDTAWKVESAGLILEDSSRFGEILVLTIDTSMPSIPDDGD